MEETLPYSYSIKQISRFVYDTTVTTPNKDEFFTQIQSLQTPNPEQLFNFFKELSKPENKNQFWQQFSLNVSSEIVIDKPENPVIIDTDKQIITNENTTYTNRETKI
jgi:hypothetical protein